MVGGVETGPLLVDEAQVGRGDVLLQVRDRRRPRDGQDDRGTAEQPREGHLGRGGVEFGGHGGDLAPVDLYVGLAKPERRRTAFALAHEARRAGMAAQLETAGRSVKGQLKHADRIGARYVALVGEEGVTLKNMETGDQRDMPADHVVTEVLKDRL